MRFGPLRGTSLLLSVRFRHVTPRPAGSHRFSLYLEVRRDEWVRVGRGAVQARPSTTQLSRCSVRCQFIRTKTILTDVSSNSTNQPSRVKRTIAYAWLRYGVALVLLLASLLKGYGFLSSPVEGETFWGSRWFLLVVVQFELLLALLLVIDPLPQFTWWLALASFAVFAATATVKAVAGETSCGCFGRVEVSPWYTLILDLTVLTALLVFGPPKYNDRHGRLWTTIATLLLVGIPAGWAIGRANPAAISDEGELLGDGSLVVLEPETWVGKRFPLMKHVDGGIDLSQGSWLVVLYRHDCSHCIEVLPRYERAARAGGQQVCLVALPPYAPPGLDPVPTGTACARGRLNQDREWFVESPAEIELSNAIVTRAATGRAISAKL